MEVRIRAVTPTDADAIAAVYAEYVRSSPATFEIDPPDAGEMLSRIEKVTAMYPWLVAEGADGVAGYAYASRHRERTAYQWAVDASAYVASDCHRQGIGRRLYTELFEIVRRQGFTNIFAGITMPNDGSVGLHRAMGFELVGTYRRIGYKLGGWHDTTWWQLRLTEGDGEPMGLRNWREVYR